MAYIAGYLLEDPYPNMTKLASHLHKKYETVVHAIWRIRERGGWYTHIEWGACLECGQVMILRPGQKFHAECVHLRILKKARERRKKHPGSSTPYARKWKQEHPREAALLRQKELEKVKQEWPNRPEEERKTLLEKAHKADKRDYLITFELADARGGEYTSDEDQYILDHWHIPAREIALELGRTLWGIRARRVFLRRHLLKSGIVLSQGGTGKRKEDR
jgi:hypothetical protein